MDRFDVQRIAAEQAAGKGVVDLSFDCAGAVKGFAETDHARVGVDAHPDDVGEFFGAQRLDRRDLHNNTPPIAGARSAVLLSFCTAAWCGHARSLTPACNISQHVLGISPTGAALQRRRGLRGETTWQRASARSRW